MNWSEIRNQLVNMLYLQDRYGSYVFKVKSHIDNMVDNIIEVIDIKDENELD